MKLILSITSFLMCLSTTSFAGDFEPFCKGIPTWAKGSVVPAAAKYVDVGSVVDGKFAKEKWDLMKKKDYTTGKWVIVDARSKKDRSVGKVPKAALITADYNNAAASEFSEATVTKKINKSLKSSYAGTKDMKDVNFILFCNGEKCHRSSFAGCELRRLGVKKENIFLMLGGFPEWQDRGFPVR